jgi:hypothetical protein
MAPHLALLLFVAGVRADRYTNDWAVECPGGRVEAEAVASDAGCSLDPGEIIPGSNFFLLTCPHVHRRSVEPHDGAHATIGGHGQVVWAEQQVAKSRKRTVDPGPQWGHMGQVTFLSSPSLSLSICSSLLPDIYSWHHLQSKVSAKQA